MDLHPEVVARGASNYRLRSSPSEPGMVMDPIPRPQGLGPGLTVRRVTSAAQLHDFAEVWCGSFRIPRWLFPLVFPNLPKDDPEFGAQTRLYAGYAEQRPVACSSVVVVERVANVVSVGTIPSARGRGYGASLTWRAVQDGHDLGADVAYLAASRIGVRSLCEDGFPTCRGVPHVGDPDGFPASAPVLGGDVAPRPARPHRRALRRPTHDAPRRREGVTGADRPGPGRSTPRGGGSLAVTASTPPAIPPRWPAPPLPPPRPRAVGAGCRAACDGTRRACA